MMRGRQAVNTLGGGMKFEEPSLKRLYGKGKEASAQQRDEMAAQRASGIAVPGLDAFLVAYPAFSQALCIFASGSLTLGWAHAKSDLDLFAVARDPIDPDQLDGLEMLTVKVSTKDPTSWVALGEIGDYRADIEIWREEQIDELIGRYAAAADKYTPRPNPAEKDLLYRLSIAAPLRGERWLQQRQAALKGSTYGYWLAETQKSDAEGLLEDVDGLLQSGDAHSAALAAHRGFCVALGALLAVYGDYSSSHKWLYHRVEKAQPRELTLEQAWHALVMTGCADDPREWAARTARLSQRMLTGVELKAL
jgi:hypothetical protein